MIRDARAERGTAGRGHGAEKQAMETQREGNEKYC